MRPSGYITSVKGKTAFSAKPVFFMAFRKKDHDCQNKLPISLIVIGIIIREEGKTRLGFCLCLCAEEGLCPYLSHYL